MGIELNMPDSNIVTLRSWIDQLCSDIFLSKQQAIDRIYCSTEDDFIAEQQLCFFFGQQEVEMGL